MIVVFVLQKKKNSLNMLFKLHKKVKDNNLQLFLIPFSFIYYVIIKLKNFLYTNKFLKRKKTSIQTICIGNASVGGNGKTPISIYLASNLNQTYNKIGILSRGYGGYSFRSPHIVSCADSGKTISDEVMLFRKNLSDSNFIVTTANRIKGVDLLKSLGVNLCIMDDGLQHLKIKPNISICLIDVEDFDHYNNFPITSIMPHGILRENFRDTLSRTDRVVFIKRDVYTDSDQKNLNLFVKKWNITSYSALNILPDIVLNIDEKSQLESSINEQVIALSSIAKPEIFHNNLEKMRYKIKKSYTFPDHYNFKNEDILKITKENPNTIVVCTEKDLVKIKELESQYSNFFYLKQKVIELSNPKEELFSWIKSKI